MDDKGDVMKKIMGLMLLVSLFVFSPAVFAVDGKALYKQQCKMCHGAQVLWQP